MMLACRKRGGGKSVAAGSLQKRCVPAAAADPWMSQYRRVPAPPAPSSFASLSPSRCAS